jgi:hypothetical protein
LPRATRSFFAQPHDDSEFDYGTIDWCDARLRKCDGVNFPHTRHLRARRKSAGDGLNAGSVSALET